MHVKHIKTFNYQDHVKKALFPHLVDKQSEVHQGIPKQQRKGGAEVDLVLCLSHYAQTFSPHWLYFREPQTLSSS